VREEETRGRRDAETQRWTRRHGDEGTGDGEKRRRADAGMGRRSVGGDSLPPERRRKRDVE